MLDTSYFLTLLGGLFLLSMFVSHLAHLLNVPRVTLLILSGVAIGPFGLNLVNGLEKTWFPTISSITLLVIGYLLGAKITKKYLLKYGSAVTAVSIVMTLATFTTVTLGLYLLSLPVELALLLGAVSVATDPTATIDVIEQDQQVNNKAYKQLIRGVVALDDVLGLLLFSIVIAVLGSWHSTEDNGLLNGLAHFSYDTFGSMLVGLILGAGLTYLLNHKRHSRPVFVESFGLILLCGGITSLLNMSYLIAAMTMGVIVINFAHKTRPHLHDIELVEQPFLILFFILAGASLELASVYNVLTLLIGYVCFRLIGRALTGFLLPAKYRENTPPLKLGLAFTSQAGVAMGMALVAVAQFPQYKNELLTVTIAATVLFEVMGPILTNWSIRSKVN